MTTNLQKIWEESPSQYYAAEFDGKPTGHFDKDEGGSYKDPDVQQDFEGFVHGWYLRKDCDLEIVAGLRKNIDATKSAISKETYQGGNAACRAIEKAIKEPE